ncbi:stringent starvation protein A, partial [Salmonella enterica subsp. enterica serovar Offa]|nr:stringent starvation protein A [Salmonella enterica subsp. enterica serovar Offa]
VSPVFKEYPYFMNEEFSLVDCYLSPLLWRLPVLGIDLSARPSSDTKHLQFYMQRVFERDSFLASLTEAEREMRLQSRG